jgi:hypothetical protein
VSIVRALARSSEPQSSPPYGPTHMIFCPGCKSGHGFRVGQPSGPNWTFNGDLEKPTFNPSLLCTWKHGDVEHRCHSFVRDGVIQFLSDCTHDLAGQTVALGSF